MNIIHYNMAAMDYIKRQIQINDSNEFWDLADKLNYHRQKAAKKKSKKINYWQDMSESEEEENES